MPRTARHRRWAQSLSVSGTCAAAIVLATSGSATVARASAIDHDSTDIYVVTPGKAGVMRLTHTGEDETASDPSWSPDSRRIAFVHVGCHTCASRIYAIPARPVASRRLGRSLAAGFHPRLSPDGRRIAFVGGDGGIYIARADGSQRRVLIRGGLADDDPNWSPDGKRIVFTQQETATQWRLYVIRADGTRIRPVPTGAAPAVNPAWSPDGRTIAFAAQRGAWQIHTVNVDGRKRRRISNGRASDSYPVWSPTGTRIAFVRQDRAGSSIYTMSSRGGAVQRVSPRWLTAVQPAWARDGRIAFVGQRRG